MPPTSRFLPRCSPLGKSGQPDVPEEACDDKFDDVGQSDHTSSEGSDNRPCSSPPRSHPRATSDASDCNWPQSPRAASPTSAHPKGVCALEDEDVRISLQLDIGEDREEPVASIAEASVDAGSIAGLCEGVGNGRFWVQLPQPPPLTESYPSTPVPSSPSSTLEGCEVACAPDHSLGLRETHGWGMHLDAMQGRWPPFHSVREDNAENSASPTSHRRRHHRGSAGHHKRHSQYLAEYQRAKTWHRRGSLWSPPPPPPPPPPVADLRLCRPPPPPSPHHNYLWPPLVNNSLHLSNLDYPIDHPHHPMSPNEVYKSFDLDVFVRPTSSSDRDRRRVSLHSPLSSLKRSLSLSLHGRRSHSPSAVPRSPGSEQFVVASSSEGSGHGGPSALGSRARPLSVLGASALASSPGRHHYQGVYQHQRAPSQLGHHAATPPSLPHSPVSPLDASLALPSPHRGDNSLAHATPHVSSTIDKQHYNNYLHHSSPNILSPSIPSVTTTATTAAATAATATTTSGTHNRIPRSGTLSPLPEMSYTSLPTTALGFDPNMFNNAPTQVAEAPLPRVTRSRDPRANMASSVRTGSAASRPVREGAGGRSGAATPSVVSPSGVSPSVVSPGTTTRQRVPYYPTDEYGLSDLSDLTISHSTPTTATTPNTTSSFTAISPLSHAAALLPPPPIVGDDHVADLSPTLAPSSLAHLDAAQATQPSSVRRSPSEPTDGRVCTPSPKLSHSSRDPTPQGSVLSTPFDERDHLPHFGTIPSNLSIPHSYATAIGGAGSTSSPPTTKRPDYHHYHHHHHSGAHREDTDTALPGSSIHSLRVHHTGGSGRNSPRQHSPRPSSPEQSPKASHAQLQLQSDSRFIQSIKNTRQQRPIIRDAHLGGQSEVHDPYYPHPFSAPNPQPGRYPTPSRPAPSPPTQQPPYSQQRPTMLLDPGIYDSLLGLSPRVRSTPQQSTPQPSSPQQSTPQLKNKDGAHHHGLFSRRANRMSQTTMSSMSSDNSSNAMSPLGVRPGQPWGLPASFEKRPSVATVFEDEPLGDREYDGATGVHEFGQRTGEWHSELENSRGNQASAGVGGGLQARMGGYGGPPSVRTQRTISNATSSIKSGKSRTHPFAANRAASPLLGVPEHLAPPGQSAGNSSRSLPSTYDSFNKQPHQVTLKSAEDDQDDAICPLCTESLSFQFRLPGEKPHVYPECGHALHYDCFVEVYGRVPAEGSRPNIGVCGICRQNIIVAAAGQDRGSGKNGKGKLSLLMGDEGGSPMDDYEEERDHNADDDLDLDGRLENGEDASKILVPNITVKSEFPSVRRNAKGKQGIRAMLTLEIPPAPPRPEYPPRSRRIESGGDATPPPLPASPMSTQSFRESSMVMANGSSHFANLENELRDRVEDYDNTDIANMGHLKLYDILKVRIRDMGGELQMYLFDRGLVCISEERRSSSLRHLFGSKNHQPKKGNKTFLKLCSLVHMTDVLDIRDTSTMSEHVLTLDVEIKDEGHNQFHIYFRDSGSMEMWKGTMRRLREESISPHLASSKTSKLTGLMLANRSLRAPPSIAPSTFTDFNNSCVATCGPQCPGDLAFQVPLAPVHTPVDVVIAISTVPVQPGARPGRKQLTLRSAVQCALACMGPRDRIALVCTSYGPNGVTRRTPLLNVTHHDSRLRLENFVDMICLGRVENDEFEIPIGRDERPDAATAINVALDIILGRKIKNPLTGFLLLSDLPEATKVDKHHMSMVTARLEAARVPVHTFGYGKAHDLSPLWAVTQQTNGSYTFVREWHDLRDAVVGCLAGLMSVALTRMKLRLTCPENDFRIKSVNGLPNKTSWVLHSSGKTVDVDLNILRHSERRELLIEFESDNADEAHSENPTSPTDGDGERSLYSNGRNDSIITASGGGSLPPRGGEALGLTMDAPSDDVFDGGVFEEVPILEVDCSFHDPAVGRSAARLTNPVLLTMTMMSSGQQSTALPDPTIVRRHMEIVTSDFIYSAVINAGRDKWDLAMRILRGIKRTVETMCDTQRKQLAHLPPTGSGRREAATAHAIDGLSATLADIDAVIDGMEESPEMFKADHRNYAMQQTNILKTQTSWAMRTLTEMHYATPSVTQLIEVGREWKLRQGTN